MDKFTFSKEMHNELDRRYSYFLSYQDLVWEIFDQFHNVCSNAGIEYYLAFGSLLGYVRDNDVIPWDSDIDVLLPIDQIDSLLNCFDNSLDSDYYYVSNVNNPSYPNYMIRLCKKGYNSDIVHVDIMYLIGAAQTENENLKLQKEIQNIIHIREKKLTSFFWKDRNNGKRRLNFHALKDRVSLIPQSLKSINKRCLRICNRYPFRGSTNYITFGHGAEFFPADIFEPRIVMRWRNGEVFLPKDYERFLTIRYGDYNFYYSIEKRFDEFMNSYKNFIQYGTREEVYNK